MENTNQSLDIQQTTKYHIFSLLEYNRDISEPKVKDLMIKIRARNKLSTNPIIITPNFLVIDGQHRLEAAKRLGVDIHYVIDPDYQIEDLTILNNTRDNWKLEDHLKKFSRLGIDDYIKLEELIKDVGITLPIALHWICDDKSRTGPMFKTGNFKFILDEKKLLGIFRNKKILTLMKKNNFKPMTIYSQSNFHRALKKLLLNEYVDFERFYSRLEKAFHKLQYTQNSFDYAEMFCEIYNHGMHQTSSMLNLQKNKKDYQYVS